jgi:glycerophosphoryl diester phosphodiesterase
MISRRALLQIIAAASVTSGRSLLALKPKLKLIAHRGGVVDEVHAENSPASLKAAIARGFWMAEVDVRRTRDGHAILQHDANFKRYYGVDEKVSDMKWEDIKKLKASPGGSRPMEFHELAALCKGKMRLMLDVKEEPHPKEFYDLLNEALTKNGLLKSTYILSGEDAEKAFRGSGPLAAADGDALKAALARGEKISEFYYLFEGADKIQDDAIKIAKEHQIDAVAAVNAFHYKGQDGMKMAEADIRRALGLGVTTFQIDSMYQSAVTSS